MRKRCRIDSLDPLSASFQALLSLLWTLATLLASCRALVVSQQLCGSGKGGSSERGRRLKYVFGDALLDGEDCLGPDGIPYPRWGTQRNRMCVQRFIAAFSMHPIIVTK